MMNPENITIGADPEVFVYDRNKKCVASAIGLIEGTKDSPQKTKHGFIQKDNVLAEFNIHPALTEAEFADNILLTMEDLYKVLDKQGHTYKIYPSNKMQPEYIKHFEAKRFGCEPDLNVWNLGKPHRVNSLQAGDLRTAGGHIHIGWDNVTPETQINVVKACDLLIGLPSVIIDHDTDRRKLYGQAGHFRPKSYGIEYRVPSNFWLSSSKLIHWAYRAAYSAIYNNLEYSSAVHSHDIAIQDAINSGDVEHAKLICNTVGIEVPVSR